MLRQDHRRAVYRTSIHARGATRRTPRPLAALPERQPFSTSRQHQAFSSRTAPPCRTAARVWPSAATPMPEAHAAPAKASSRTGESGAGRKESAAAWGSIMSRLGRRRAENNRVPPTRERPFKVARARPGEGALPHPRPKWLRCVSRLPVLSPGVAGVGLHPATTLGLMV